MRVIVVGAGEVGYFIAAKLSEEGQDVVVIDQCPQALEKVGENLDVLTVLGSGGHASVLERAGAKEADLLIAVTETDEVNMISCLLGKRFGVKETVARVSSDDFPAGNMFTRNELGIDLMINPEELVAAEILKLLKTPLATEVDYFAHGKVEMVGYRVPEGAKLVDSQLKNLPFPPDCLVVAIARHNDVIIPQGGDHIKAHDIIYVLGPRGNSSKLLWLLGGGQGVIKKVMIVGAGRIGLALARYLQEHDIAVTLIEENEGRCQGAAQSLEHVLVIRGNGTDLNLLQQEEIGTVDAFVSVTENDEVNIIAGVLAKELGAKKSIVKVSRTDYAIIVDTLGIDAAVHPRLLTASTILRLVRKGGVVALAFLKEGKAEAIEFMVDASAPIINQTLTELPFPRGAILGAIVREGKVIIPRGRDVILPGDEAIVFTLPEALSAVERLFSAGGKPRFGRGGMV